MKPPLPSSSFLLFSTPFIRFSVFFCVFGKEGREFWLQVFCCGRRIKSVTALTQLNVKLAKHTSPGRLSETNHIITGQTPSGPLPSNSNPAVQSANILVSNQMCSLIVKILRTLRLSSWRQWMRVTPVSHMQFIEVYPSAREESTSMPLAEQSQILTDVPDQHAPVASGEVQIDRSPWTKKLWWHYDKDNNNTNFKVQHNFDFVISCCTYCLLCSGVWQLIDTSHSNQLPYPNKVPRIMNQLTLLPMVSRSGESCLRSRPGNETNEARACLVIVQSTATMVMISAKQVTNRYLLATKLGDPTLL